jgi:hypothetical protein
MKAGSLMIRRGYVSVMPADKEKEISAKFDCERKKVRAVLLLNPNSVDNQKCRP